MIDLGAPVAWQVDEFRYPASQIVRALLILSPQQWPKIRPSFSKQVEGGWVHAYPLRVPAFQASGHPNPLAYAADVCCALAVRASGRPVRNSDMSGMEVRGSKTWNLAELMAQARPRGLRPPARRTPWSHWRTQFLFQADREWAMDQLVAEVLREPDSRAPDAAPETLRTGLMRVCGYRENWEMSVLALARLVSRMMPGVRTDGYIRRVAREVDFLREKWIGRARRGEVRDKFRAIQSARGRRSAAKRAGREDVRTRRPAGSVRNLRDVAMRRAHRDGRSVRRLAAEYRMSASRVRQIVRPAEARRVRNEAIRRSGSSARDLARTWRMSVRQVQRVRAVRQNDSGFGGRWRSGRLENQGPEVGAGVFFGAQPTDEARTLRPGGL